MPSDTQRPPVRPVMVGGQPMMDRLMQQLSQQRWRHENNTPLPSAAQVAMVLHALADHTALEFARTFDRHNYTSGREDHLWPTSLSIGRFLHAVGDDLDQRADAEVPEREPGANFEGCGTVACGEHRTVGPHRAWCYVCTDWCYPDEPCVRGKLAAAGLE